MRKLRMVYAWQLVSVTVNHTVQANTWFAHVYARYTHVYARFTHGLRMVYAWFAHVYSIVSKDLSMIRMFTLFLGILT